MAEERKVPEVGRIAPAFTLKNQNGESVKLDDFKGSWLVLYFYPKDDTPGCTTEACDFTASIKDFKKLDATVVGVSPDTVESHKKFADKHDLKITLLADPSKKALMKYGAWGVKKLYGKEHEGVIRSTFLIDPDGKIAHVWPNVRAKGHADKVQETLKEKQAA